MKRTSIGGGVYRQFNAAGRPLARFWERPGGKTWRLQRGVTTAAEARKRAAHRNPKTSGKRFAGLAEAYIVNRCPGADNVPRPDLFCAEEIARVRRLIQYFGTWSPHAMSAADWHGYYLDRVGGMSGGRCGKRAVDKDRQTLSNIFRQAVIAGRHPANPFYHGCPRYYKLAGPEVRHAKHRAPETGQTIHDLAAHFFRRVETESVGWWLLFAMFDGFRVSENLSLRLAARQISIRPLVFESGYIQTLPGAAENEPPRQLLHLFKRGKGGILPVAVIIPEFADMIGAWRNWHATRFPESPWYFPNITGQCLHRRRIGDQLEAACRALGIPKIVPHGLRSFFSTKQRSDGKTEAQTANLMGDKTVALVQSSYAVVPANWLGGAAVSWLPDQGEPAWAIWRKPKINDFLLTTENRGIEQTSIDTGVPWWRAGRRTGLVILPPRVS